MTEVFRCVKNKRPALSKCVLFNGWIKSKTYAHRFSSTNPAGFMLICMLTPWSVCWILHSSDSTNTKCPVGPGAYHQSLWCLSWGGASMVYMCQCQHYVYHNCLKINRAFRKEILNFHFNLFYLFDRTCFKEAPSFEVPNTIINAI